MAVSGFTAGFPHDSWSGHISPLHSAVLSVQLSYSAKSNGVRRSLNTRYFNGLISNFSCCFTLDIYNPLNFVAGAADSSLTDIDLLGTIGEPLPLGVSLTKGPHTKPAFNFRSVANVGRFARYIFPKQFFKEFSITVAFRPKRADHGVLFAILPNYRARGVILGLEIRSGSFTKDTTISLIHANNARTKTVFEFTVPDITGKWTWLALSIKKDGVTFYHDCKEIETKFGPSSLADLSLPSYSVLYIGRAGWTSGAHLSTFEVSA